MLTLKADSAVTLDPDEVLLLDSLPNAITLSNYDPSGSFVGLHWNVSSINTNIKMTTRVSWDTTVTPNNTFFMIFGATSGNDPRTDNNSVYVELGCIGGFVVFKLSKRVDGELTSRTETTTVPWSNGVLFTVIGLNAALQKLVVITNTNQDFVNRQSFELAILPYAFTRIDMFATSTAVSPSITNLSLNTRVEANTGFVYNKNKTPISNMVDYVKLRTGLEFNANDIIFSNIRGPGVGDTVNNTRIDITGSGNGVLIGNTTLSYRRIPIYSIYPTNSRYEDLILAEPFTAQSIITAYNTQYAMNLTETDVILSPSSGATFTEYDSLTMTASPTNTCLEGSIYITLYHPS